MASSEQGDRTAEGIRVRPEYVVFEGWTENIRVHDEYYMRRKAWWKRERARNHPDRGCSAFRFRRAQAGYREWRRLERLWYWRRGLMPPDWTRGEPEPPKRHRLVIFESSGTAGSWKVYHKVVRT